MTSQNITDVLEQIADAVDEVPAAEEDGASPSQTTPVSQLGERLRAEVARVVVGMEEQQAYQQAFAHLRKLEYPEAVSGFAAYLKAYPEGRYAAKAQYWLGEIRYVRGAYKQAIAEYRKLIEQYPDNPKVPEAMLKIGLSYRELGKRSAARKQLSELMARFPDSPEAEEARKYLKK